MKRSTGQQELTSAGFTSITPLGTRTRYTDEFVVNGAGNVVPGLKAPAKYGKWYECDTPRGTLSVREPERVLMLRQARNIWHAFYPYRATASGSTPLCALTMGLGDAISTDGELRAYSRLVNKAPRTWADKFAGLAAAKEQVYNNAKK